MVDIIPKKNVGYLLICLSIYLSSIYLFVYLQYLFYHILSLVLPRKSWECWLYLSSIPGFCSPFKQPTDDSGTIDRSWLCRASVLKLDAFGQQKCPIFPTSRTDSR